MKLKAILDSLDDVPEALRELYVARDGKYHLDEIEGYEPTGRLKEFRDNNIKLLKERDELKTQLGKFADIDPEKYQEALKKLQDLDDKQMMDDGKIEELLQTRTERLRSDYESKLKSYDKKFTDQDSQIKTLSDELSKERIDGRLREAAGTVGVRKTAIPDLINRGRQVWRLVEGEPVAMRGEEILYGKDPAKPIGMPEWIESLATDAPHLFETSSGGGATNTTNGHQRGARVIARYDPVSIGKHAEEIASGKAIVQ
jgi:hypothetical protein